MRAMRAGKIPSALARISVSADLTPGSAGTRFAVAHGVPSNLRVMTYNIPAAKGVDGAIDLPRIADVIRSYQPRSGLLKDDGSALKVRVLSGIEEDWTSAKPASTTIAVRRLIALATRSNRASGFSRPFRRSMRLSREFVTVQFRSIAMIRSKRRW